MATLKYGVIGCGSIANYKHMPAVATFSDEIEMTAFCDIVIERAEKAKLDFGTKTANIYTDYKELLKDDSIDAVLICTPNREHSQITIDALDAGKHVLCEKPMAKTTAEATAMLNASKRSGKVLTIGYQNRFRPDVLYANSCCRDGELGDIYVAKAHAIRRRKVPTWGVFIDKDAQGGGPLIDIGTHALDLTLWCMDNYKPKYVVGNVYHKLSNQRNTANQLGEWDPAKFTVEDSAFGFITMENGATIFLESSWALNTLDEGEAIFSLSGTQAGLDFREGLRINTVKHNKMITEIPTIPIMKPGQPIPLDENHPNVIEQRVFKDAILGVGEIVIKPEQALVVTRILEAVYKSGETGLPVIFNE